jgi:hypothetical protein
LINAANKGNNNPETQQTKRVQSKRKLESITHQNTIKQIEEQEELEGRKPIEDQNEKKSDSSYVSASMPDLESSTSEDEGDFEHENVFPPDRSNTIDVGKDTALQVKYLCHTVRKYSYADCYSIFICFY